MKIIVAGFPKTGTKSMTAALRRLGYTVYDFMENLYYLEHDWDTILTHKTTSDVFKTMYTDVDAVVDMPACYFWEEIHKQFPDAKIILTVRDDEEIWVKSLINHIRVLDCHVLARILQWVEIMLGRRSGLLLTESYKLLFNIERTVWGKKSNINEPILKMKYRAHNAHVIQNAPSDKLLVFNCKDGWDSLCKFLDVTAPNEPFPHENINAQLVEDSATKHPLGAVYKKELSAACLRMAIKVTLGVGVAACFATMIF